MVKIALLAEKFSTDFTWYVNTMIQVILAAGDFVAEAVWFRIVQIITNNTDIHEFAAERLLGTVQSKWAHEIIVALAGYVLIVWCWFLILFNDLITLGCRYMLGEIGVNICEKPGMSGYDQFAALHQHFANVSVKTQCVLLTAYMKLLNLYPDQTKDLVTDVFSKYASSSQLELQQRAVEYLQLSSVVAPATLETVLNTMPVYEVAERNILQTIGTDHADFAGTDRSAWTMNAEEKQASRQALEKPNVGQETSKSV